MSFMTKHPSAGKPMTSAITQVTGSGEAPERKSGRYMPGLDGLRALAVLAVIVYHLHPGWLPGGFLGVGVFFVLSGYLITDLLVAQWKRDGALDLKDFWIRRFRRLLPALFAMLAVVVTSVILFFPAQIASLRGDVLAAVTYMNNWRFIYHQVSYFESFGPPSPLTHLWSLAVEEQFYIVWPLLLLLGLRYAPRRGVLLGLTAAGAAVSALAMVLLYEPGTDPSRVYYGTDTRAFALLIGAALAMVWPSRKLIHRSSLGIRILLESAGSLGLLIVAAMMLFANQYDAFLYQGGLVLLSLATAVTIAVIVHPESSLGKLLGCKPLKWIGVRSYGIYLWHYPVIILTSPAVDTNGVDPVRDLMQLAVSILLAAWSWRFVEEPIRRGAWRKLRAGSLLRSRGEKLGYAGISRWFVSLCLLAVLSVGLASRLHPAADTASAASAAVGESMPETQSVDSAAPPPSDFSSNAAQNDEMPKSSDGKGNATGRSVIPPPFDSTQYNGQNQQDLPVTTQAVSEASPPSEADAPSVSDGHVGQEEDVAPTEATDRRKVTAIGDSVLLDAAPYFTKIYPGVEIFAQVGRQMAQASSIIEQLKSGGSLGDTVIIELGTNGAFSPKQLDSLIELIGQDRRIVLVNTRVPRPWEEIVNSALNEAKASHTNITLVDWHAASTNKDSYFTPDGVHLEPEGAEFYASLLADAITPELSQSKQLVVSTE